MAYRLTAKAIRENGGIILKAGYCELQNLLHGESRFGYTCGVYGWNFDAYAVNGITICTGYRGMVGWRYLDNETVEKYEKAAESIMHNYEKPYEERNAARKELLKQFCDEVKAAATK